LWTTNPEERTGSFVRWQAITIGQLTIAINVILGFAGATLAFGANLLIKEPSHLTGWVASLYLASLAVLLVSMGVGVWCVINRLRDFRATMRAARKRETGASDAAIEPLRKLYLRLGTKTWTLFWWQIGTFLVGVALMVVSLGVLAWARLFCQSIAL
jgi:hypothetical protein